MSIRISGAGCRDGIPEISMQLSNFSNRVWAQVLISQICNWKLHTLLMPYASTIYNYTNCCFNLVIMLHSSTLNHFQAKFSKVSETHIWAVWVCAKKLARKIGQRYNPRMKHLDNQQQQQQQIHHHQNYQHFATRVEWISECINTNIFTQTILRQKNLNPCVNQNVHQFNYFKAGA